MERSVAPWGGFRYAMCSESMQGLLFAEQCAIVAGAGYRGIELAAFTFVKEGVEDVSPRKRVDMVKTMERAGLACAGLHWLLAPPPAGLHFTTPDAETRARTVAYFESLIDFCGDLGGPIMVFGSPKQRSAKGIPAAQARAYFKAGLAKVAERARRRNVTVLIEALDRTQSDVVNTLAEARALVEELAHPAIELMFDFHNTADETEPFDALIGAYYDRIRHVHVQELDGKHLGCGSAVDAFVPGFQALKDRRYARWVSLEAFDFAPGPKRIAEESLAVLRKIEAKLA
jgi:D-psicose/D-tagatose/L-ribulose 3-epimerase